MNIFTFIKILPTNCPNEPYHFAPVYLSVPFRVSTQALIFDTVFGSYGYFLEEVSHLISVTLEGGQGRHCIPPFVT